MVIAISVALRPRDGSRYLAKSLGKLWTSAADSAAKSWSPFDIVEAPSKRTFATLWTNAAILTQNNTRRVRRNCDRPSFHLQ
jgi:hypothetical protein